jgi:D-alanyl-D-alanine carboxypeptidase/D-alanyl-D-alanine-endopeptidase (penicillin-binding protein 4)
VLDPKAWQLTAGSVVLGLLVAAGAVVAAGPWDNGQRRAEREWAAGQRPAGGAPHEDARQPAPAPSAGPVLAAIGARGTGGARNPAKAGTHAQAGALSPSLAKRLGTLLSAPALGSVTSGAVVDVATGKQLYAKSADRSMTPASTVKLATMTAALSAVGPDHRIATTVVADAAGKKVTLVGGGDPSLDEEALGALADDTARALRKRGVKKVALGYDTSLYSGPREHPIGPNDNIAPVVALTLDEGRLNTSTSGPAPRSGDPAGDTAEEFVRLLHDRGIDARKDPRPAKAAKGTRRVAVSYSAPVSDLVERALTESDNDIAEAMARQTAIAKGLPASFSGAAKAVRKQLG